MASPGFTRGTGVIRKKRLLKEGVPSINVPNIRRLLIGEIIKAPGYGIDLVNRLIDSGALLPSGSQRYNPYPILRHLEAAGFLSSTMEPRYRRPKVVVYHVTDLGKKWYDAGEDDGPLAAPVQYPAGRGYQEIKEGLERVREHPPTVGHTPVTLATPAPRQEVAAIVDKHRDRLMQALAPFQGILDSPEVRAKMQEAISKVLAGDPVVDVLANAPAKVDEEPADLDQLVRLSWDVTVSQIGTLRNQQALIVERLRKVAAEIEKVPEWVFHKFWQTPTKRTGGMCGEPANNSDPGWKAVWSVEEDAD